MNQEGDPKIEDMIVISKSLLYIHVALTKIITTKPTNVPHMSTMFGNPIQWSPRVFTKSNLPTQDIIDSNLIDYIGFYNGISTGQWLFKKIVMLLKW